MENKDTLGQDKRKQDDDLLRDTTYSYGPEEYEGLDDAARQSWENAKRTGRDAWNKTKETGQEIEGEFKDAWRRATDED